MSNIGHIPFTSGGPLSISKLGFSTRFAAFGAQATVGAGTALALDVGRIVSGAVRVAVGVGSLIAPELLAVGVTSGDRVAEGGGDFDGIVIDALGVGAVVTALVGTIVRIGDGVGLAAST